MNYKRNKKYFTSSIGLMYLGLTLIIFGVFTLPISFFIGTVFIPIILIVGGIVCFIVQSSSKPSGKDIDDDLFNFLAKQDLKSRALDRLGIDESEVMEIEPVYFDGYHFEGSSVVRDKKDNKARASMGRAVYFFFTKNEVYCYTYTVSLIDNNISEDTDTYFYSDIVSVATTTATGTISNPAKPTMAPINYQYDCFKLTTTGGTSMQAGLRDKAGAERSINGMRNLIKAKKQG